MHRVFHQIDRPVLQIGSHHPIVRDLQQRLSQCGRPIPMTGIFDAETEIAVKYFQSRVFLKPDGVVGPFTWYALDRDGPIFQPVLYKGCSGNWVEALQELLAIDLYYQGRIDGEFDDSTESAVQRFQAEYGLTATGIVDDRTWNALSEL